MFGKRSLVAALLAVVVAVYLLPSPIDPKPHVLKGPPPALEGPLAVNTRLQKGRRLFTGKLHGPESFTADEEGNVFTGTVDGKLWRIGPDDSLTLVTHMGRDLPECGRSTDLEPVCGRPHGVRLDRRGQLIVADSYLGLHSVDPKTGEKTLLVSNSQGADGVPFSFLNGLEISSQTGLIYFTDSSSRWGRRHVKLEVIELNSLGRLLSYDPETGGVSVLLDSLFMPNGIALSPDEHFLLLAETSIGRILRFWLKGPKAGTKEVVMDNMIGYPDNVRRSDRGTFLVGITTTRFRKATPPFLDLIAPYPAVKRLLSKVCAGGSSQLVQPAAAALRSGSGAGPGRRAGGVAARPRRPADVGRQRRVPAPGADLPGQHRPALPARAGGRGAPVTFPTDRRVPLVLRC